MYPLIKLGKFSQKIDKLNKIGVESIGNQKYKEALLYLNEAEKIL